MSEWESVNLSSILPDEIADIIATSREVIDGLAEIMSALSILAAGSAAFIDSFIDPLAIIVAEFIATLEAFVELYAKAGVYTLSVTPGLAGNGYRQSTDQFIAIIENSLYDSADPQRPTFSSGAVTGVVILAGAPSIEELLDILASLALLFRADDLNIIDVFDKLTLAVTLDVGLVYGISPQKVSITGDLSKFPDSGVIRIGDEITTYASKLEDGFDGVIIRSIHDEGETITVIDSDGSASQRTRLTSDVSGVGFAEDIFVESTEGFPGSGSILIGSEEIPYEKKNSDSFIGVFPRVPHTSGSTVSLNSGNSFHGAPPDWNNIALSEVFAEFNFIVQGFTSLAGALAPATDFLSALSDFLLRISGRVDRIRSELEKLSEALEKFAALLEITGVYVLVISGSSVDDFIEELKSAEGKPEFDESAYTAGYVIMAGAEASSALTGLFSF